MTCPICLKEFTPRTKQQRYCKKACADKAHNPKRRSEAKQMAVEWLAWNHDFKLGKTASNLQS